MSDGSIEEFTEEAIAAASRVCGCSPDIKCVDNSQDGEHCDDCGEKCTSQAHQEAREEA